MTIAPIDRLDEIRQCHLELSEQDWKFRDAARQSPECLRRSSFELLDRRPGLVYFRQQAWPTFVRRSKIQELAQVSVAVSGLIRSIPQRVFRNDPVAMAHFYSVDNPLFLKALLDPPNGIAGALARGDFIYGPRGLHCLEFNVLPNLGGWENRILSELHLAVPVTARLIAELGIRVSYTNTLRELFSHLLDEAREKGLDQDGEVNVVTTFSESRATSPSLVAFDHYLSEDYRAVLDSRGGRIRGSVASCRYEDLTLQGSRLFQGAMRVHSLLEFERHTDPRAFRSFKTGRLNLYNGPVWQLLTDKRNIALLSDEEVDAGFTPEERSLLRQHIPWTRVVRAAHTTFRGERVFLPDLLEARRPELVLKKSLGHGGREVQVGAYSTPAEWSDTIRVALEAPVWVVQEFIPSHPYLYQDGDDGCSPHDVIWGPFVFGQRYAGTFVRVQPKADRAVVNLSQTATQGFMFEVEDPG
jgi:hypothetical protein